jgi:hypothetical protein
MLQARGQQDLSAEPFGADAGGEVRRQNLDDYAPSERALFGDEDAAHTAPTKLSLDRVRTRECGLNGVLKHRRHWSTRIV